MDWAKTQAKLGVPADGKPGPQTYGALYAYAAGRAPDAATILRGQVAAKHFAEFSMTTPARIAEFIAQCCNETGGFRVFEENLRYSASGMLKTWPSHFTSDQAAQAVGNPILVASRAYGGRMGNAPFPSQDGYTYRGRGDLQLTGRANYQRFGDLLGVDLVGNPDLASGEAGPLIALEFFKLGNVNAFVDRGDFAGARRVTNGGAIGLDNVARIRNRLLGVLL